MLSLSATTRYLLYSRPTDIRKSFDSLSGIIRNELGRDPLTGEVFVFVSKRRTHIKLLQWEGDGYGLYYKRLEKGTYELPPAAGSGAEALCLTAAELQLILGGISLRNIKYRPRYQHKALAECV
jgi:transposase